MDGFIGLFVDAAVAGEGERGLGVLEGSVGERYLEPLVVGLALYLGRDVYKAQEIMEVGKDIVKRIEERKGKLILGPQSG